MAIWKEQKNDWLKHYAEEFMNFSNEIESEANIFSEADTAKLKTKMTTIRLMFNRYAKNE